MQSNFFSGLFIWTGRVAVILHFFYFNIYILLLLLQVKNAAYSLK